MQSSIDLSALPEHPGCYLYHDSTGTIIYVGKAKNLKKRVSSYFQKNDLDPKTRLLVSEIAGLDFIVTETEVEALILENNLIKKHLPRFNIDLKDAKSYAYIQISDDPYPRIGIARHRGGKKTGTLYGPFVSAAERDQVLHFIKQTFRLRTCRKMNRKSCLRYHLGTCSAPCQEKISEPEYQYLIRDAELLLKGKNQDLISELRARMEDCSAKNEFEQALVLRDQIQAIKRLSERQYVQRQKREDEHIINFQVSSGTVYLMLFSVEKGILAGKEEYRFDWNEDAIEEFLVQYYAGVTPPHELILPHEVDPSLAEYLSAIRGTNVSVVVPKHGAKKHLLDLVHTNIEASFFRGEIRTIELAEILDLPAPPEVIESFDISHLSGTGMVGSMVSFRNGKPDKANYRRFRIRDAGKGDDYAAIGEVVRRRYSRLKKEEKPLPDLVLIDGGPGQLGAAKDELDRLGLSIPVISIAKREEQIYRPGRRTPLPLKRKDPASLLLQEIRDETHRFVITYQRQTRRKQIRS